MNENLEQAVNELKRADHMIFVSLKYTRTVDVIKNILERLILCFDSAFDALVDHLKENKKIEEIPKTRSGRLDLVKKSFKDLESFFELYSLLRKLNKANFTRRQEFRRHVTMSVILEDKRLVEINIDVINDYYDKTKSFVDFVVSLDQNE